MSETEEEDLARKKQKRVMRYGAICIVILIIAVVVPVVVVVTGDAGEKEVDVTEAPATIAPTAMPSGAPTSEKFSTFLTSLIPLYDNDDLYDATFSNYDSAQYQAALWVIEEDPLNLDLGDPRLLNRFILAAFYFSTNGDEWLQCGRESTLCDDAGEWLSSSSECSWLGITCVDEANNDFRISELFFRKYI
jgi:hypothetical protein